MFAIAGVPHVEVVSPVFHTPAPYGVYEGGSSRPGGAPQAPEAVTATATPKPNPHVASAAAKGVFVDCNGMDLPAGKYFFNPPVALASGDANAWSAS
jgi:hypothetical protein